MSGILRALCVALTMLLCAGVTATPVAAQAGKEKPASADRAAKAQAKQAAAPTLRGYYAIMASEAQLSPDQQAKVVAILQQRGQELKAWNDANQQKVVELKAKAKAAEGEEAKKLRGQARELGAQKNQINDKYAQQIEEVMTPEQSRAWAGYGLYHRCTITFKDAAMTDEQKQQARELAGQVMAKEFGQSRADAQKSRALYAQYSKEVKEQVLTDEQRKAFDDAAAARRQGKAAGADKPQKQEAAAGDKPAKK